jgi:hypothetical protein
MGRVVAAWRLHDESGIGRAAEDCNREGFPRWLAWKRGDDSSPAV